MKPVCVPCQRFFRCKKSGFYFIEAMPTTRDTTPGINEPDHWMPYKLWVGDEWECRGCGAVILSGFGNAPIAEHYQENFGEMVKKTNASQLQVNDC